MATIHFWPNSRPCEASLGAQREIFTDFLSFSFNFLLISMQVSAPTKSRSGAPSSTPGNNPERAAPMLCFVTLNYLFS